MAINIEYIHKAGIEPYDLMLMELIAQNASDDMTEALVLYLNDKSLKRLMALDFLTTVAAKRKSDHDFRRLRLSKKGKAMLRDARKLQYTPEDAGLYAYLHKVYDQVEKPVGNPEKVKELLAWFRTEGQYTRKQIFKAVRLYVSIQEGDQGGKYIPSLENLLWKSGNMYSSTWKLSESRLYQFINENKDILNANISGKR